MPHIIGLNENHLYTALGSGFSQHQQTLLCKKTKQQYYTFYNQVMGCTFEKLKSKLPL